MWARIINTILGLWLMAAPTVLGYTDTVAATNHRIVGPIVVSFAVIAMWEATRPVHWVNLPLGIWLLISPLVFGGYGSAPLINSVVVGALVAVCALVRGTYRPERYGGGWSVLWK